MTNKKEIQVIIKFDYKNYSKEETIFLYQRFFEILAEAKDMKAHKNLGKILYNCILNDNCNITLGLRRKSREIDNNVGWKMLCFYKL